MFREEKKVKKRKKTAKSRKQPDGHKTRFEWIHYPTAIRCILDRFDEFLLAPVKSRATIESEVQSKIITAAGPFEGIADGEILKVCSP